MQIIVAKNQKHLRKKDYQALKKLGAKFYHNVKFEEIEELKNDEPKIFAVQPASLKKGFKSLPWRKLSTVKNLRNLILATTAFGWVDLKKLKEKKILVSNCPGKATSAVAEGYFHALLSLVRKIPLLIQNDWESDFNKLIGREIVDLKIGIVGLGRIGNKFGKILSNYGCEIYYWNRTKKEASFRYLSLAKLFREVDCVFLSFATGEHLKRFISNKLVNSMKKDAYILSCIDHDAYDHGYIIKRVQDNKLSGFAFESGDVKMQDIVGNIWIVPDSYYYFTDKTRDEESRIFTKTILLSYRGKAINVVN